MGSNFDRFFANLPKLAPAKICSPEVSPSGGIINSSTSFRVVAISLIGDFISTPPLYEYLEKYPPPLQLSTKE